MVLYFVQESLKPSVMFSDDLNYSQAIFIEPPKKIKISDSICAKKFHLDPIIEMYKSEKHFGIVTVSGKEFNTFHIIQTGKHIDIKLKFSKDVLLQNSTRKGSQSANQIHRLGVEKKQMSILN